jgi:hypothetical protein
MASLHYDHNQIIFSDTLSLRGTNRKMRIYKDKHFEMRLMGQYEDLI